MNQRILFCFILFFWINIHIGRSQTIKPTLIIQDHPVTHNFHLVSDGNFYYTINGGRAKLGQIRKFDLSGKLVDAFPIDLDMRSIMYDPKTKKFLIYANDYNIYQITNLLKGEYKLLHSKIFTNDQAVPALSTDGKLLYYFEDGSLKIYKSANGKFMKEIKGLKCGDNFAQGSITVAVDRDYIYTWDAEKQIIYLYNLDGRFEKSVTITNGSFGASLSAANGFIFVADDGNYDMGVWYGYDVRSK